MFKIINLLIESWEVCLKCRDCDNSLFDSSIVPYGGLNPPLTAILSTHLFMFYVFSESLPVSTRIDISATCGKMDFFETPKSAKKKKIYVHKMSKIIANLVYCLSLHEFSVVSSG